MFSKDFYERHVLWVSIILTVFFVALFMFVMEHFYFEYFFHPNQSKWDIANDIDKIYSACLIILTFILVIVAWTQLAGIKRISKADFLLRLDGRLSSSEIIKARAIIQRLYSLTKSSGNCEDTHIDKIADQIKDMGQNPMDSLEFTYLLNFLDFLETISYYCNRNYISLDDLDDLLGNTMVYYYKVFKKWIYYRKGKYNDNFYKELETVIENIEKRR